MVILRALRSSLKLSRRFCSSPTITITEEKVDIGGDIKVNYVKSSINQKSEKGVICLPGALGSCWNDFKPQIEKLPPMLSDFDVIAWDPIGYGKSIPPKRDFSLNFLEKDADNVEKLMQTLGYSKYSVIGWSDGGITGLILSGKYPESIEKLIIFGSNAYIVHDEIKIYESIRDVNKWSKKMRDPMEKMYGAEEFKSLWENWVDTCIRIYKEKDGDICKSFLDKIKADTLILHGEKDPMIVSEHIPYLLKAIKGSKLYSFPEGKHNIHLRYADDFNKIVAHHLKN